MGWLPPYAPPEVGGRRCRQPGQVRKEAATTISCRVVGFHLFRPCERSEAIPRCSGLPRRYAPRNDSSEAVNENKWTTNRPALDSTFPKGQPLLPARRRIACLRASTGRRPS